MDYIQIALQIRELLENLIDLLDIHIINACRRKCNVRFFQIIDFRIVQNVQKRGRNMPIKKVPKIRPSRSSALRFQYIYKSNPNRSR